MKRGTGDYRAFDRGRAAKLFVLLAVMVPYFFVSAGTPAQAQGQELYVVAMHPRSLLLFDGSRDEIVGEIQTRGRNPREVVPSPDGRFVYTTTEGRAQLEMINLQTRKVERVFDLAPPGYRLTIYGVAINSKGDRLYAHVKPVRELADEYRVDPPQIWAVDVNTGKSEKIVEVPQGVAALVMTKDGRRLIAWGRDLYYIDLAQGRITDTFPLFNRNLPGQGPLDTLPLFIEYERSGVLSCPYYTTDPILKKILFGLANLDLNTGKVDLVELGPAIPLYSSVVSGDRKRAYGVMNQLVAVDLPAGRVLNVQDLERTQYITNISRDGKKLYVSGASYFIHVYDTETLKLIKTVKLSGDTSIAFSAIPAAAVH